MEIENVRTMLESLPQPVVLILPGVDAGKSVIQAVNNAAAKMGFVAGKTAMDSPFSWLPALVGEVLRTRARAGIQDNASIIRLAQAARKICLAPQANPLLDPHGELSGITISFLDVTHECQTEDARTAFLSTLSHKLKSPMTSIQMSIHLLLEDAAARLTPRQVELLQAAAVDSDRLLEQIEELLATARERMKSSE